MGSALYAGRNSAEDGSVWFLPCLFVRPGSRRKGVAAALLTTAVDTARTYGATAVEGFPLAGGEKRASADAYLGTEAMFLAAGFEVDRRPSAKRVIMRLTLAP
jgi:GNAT superfamily N-acetyltransferase